MDVIACKHGVKFYLIQANNVYRSAAERHLGFLIQVHVAGSPLFTLPNYLLESFRLKIPSLEESQL